MINCFNDHQLFEADVTRIGVEPGGWCPGFNDHQLFEADVTAASPRTSVRHLHVSMTISCLKLM